VATAAGSRADRRVEFDAGPIDGPTPHRGKGATMAFEAIKAQISNLLEAMENQPEDKHELYLQLHEKLNEWRATGQPVPADLAQLERALEAEFVADLGAKD
jgi:hypothetical protein